MVDFRRPTPGDIYGHLGNIDEPYEVVGFGLIEGIPSTADLNSFGATLGAAYLGIALSAQGYEVSGEIDQTEHHVFQSPEVPWCHIIILTDTMADDDADRKLHCVYRQGDHGNFPGQLWLRTEDDFQSNFTSII